MNVNQANPQIKTVEARRAKKENRRRDNWDLITGNAKVTPQLKCE